MSEIGDNVGAERIKQFVQRIEKLEDEKSEIAIDIREVYAEAKSLGFDTKVLRKVIARRKMAESDRIAQDELLSLYEGVFE
jgi:uncharacterized protein (UPF0335 family)